VVAGNKTVVKNASRTPRGTPNVTLTALDGTAIKHTHDDKTVTTKTFNPSNLFKSEKTVATSYGDAGQNEVIMTTNN
jgi:hypothetical protein